MIAWFLACAPEGDVDRLDGTCTVDACADGGVEDGLACCIDAHGMGAAGEVTVEPWVYCATEETYDPAEFLSEDAARCAAQVYGLGPGEGECRATLVVCEGDAEWWVKSLVSGGCGWSEWEGVLVDARTGVVIVWYGEMNDGVCDG